MNDNKPVPQQPISYRPVPFNFVDLEEKASDYLARVKSEALQIAAQARNEVARLREATFNEIHQARHEAQLETEKVRTQLDALKQKLQNEEESFKKRKEQLEGEAIKLKAAVKQNEDVARKKGYDEGHSLGYDEGKKSGYNDGETQATIDYAEKVRNEAEVQLGAKLETLLPALSGMVRQLDAAKQSFLLRWEESAVGVATSIAQRAISQQLPEMPEVSMNLLRESLELGAGSTQLKIRLNPNDYESLKPQIKILVDELAGAAKTEIVPDARISPAGCVLETSLGLIDNRIESRLQRIEEELCLNG